MGILPYLQVLPLNYQKSQYGPWPMKVAVKLVMRTIVDASISLLFLLV